jgi:hypothetical protein
MFLWKRVSKKRSSWGLIQSLLFRQMLCLSPPTGMPSFDINWKALPKHLACIHMDLQTLPKPNMTVANRSFVSVYLLGFSSVNKSMNYFDLISFVVVTTVPWMNFAISENWQLWSAICCSILWQVKKHYPSTIRILGPLSSRKKNVRKKLEKTYSFDKRDI